MISFGNKLGLRQGVLSQACFNESLLEAASQLSLKHCDTL